MTEIIFIVEDVLEGGFTAKALSESIFTEAETIEQLKANVKEAVECHFDEAHMPKIIRLHQVKEELIAI
jgi:predicted RNase H-like HicB family nuclease